MYVWCLFRVCAAERRRGFRGEGSDPRITDVQQSAEPSDGGRGPLCSPGRHGLQRILGPIRQSVRAPFS